MSYLKTIILEPQAERSVIWMAGRKDMDGQYYIWIADRCLQKCLIFDCTYHNFIPLSLSHLISYLLLCNILILLILSCNCFIIFGVYAQWLKSCSRLRSWVEWNCMPWYDRLAIWILIGQNQTEPWFIVQQFYWVLLIFHLYRQSLCILITQAPIKPQTCLTFYFCMKSIYLHCWFIDRNMNLKWIYYALQSQTSTGD